jgi:hypothetical protein
MLYVTLILGSNGSGDVSSRPLLQRITTIVIPGVFWRYFFPPKFCGWAPHKSSHPFSLSPPIGSYHVSKFKQQSDDRPTCKEGVLPELPCPRQLEPSNHKREPSLRVVQVPLLFGKHPFIYMHVCIWFS